VNTVILNYMALHGQQNLFDQPLFFPNHGLGDVNLRDSLTAFNTLPGISNGLIGPLLPL
jgi:hypothetical protein